jgi:hypothetical protein
MSSKAGPVADGAQDEGVDHPRRADALETPRPSRHRCGMRRLTIALALALGLVSACATVTPVAWTPNPARIANPADEVRTIILANVVQGCIAEPEFTTPTMLIVKFVCTSGGGGVGNFVARLDQVERITIEESGGWYRTSVKHTSGIEDFTWTSRSQQDMERLADALTALAAGPAESTPAPVAGAADI